MARLVKKFGGTSVASLDRIRTVAGRVKEAHDRGDEIIVVTSAMAGETDRLAELCAGAGPGADRRECDMVLATGEQVAAGLFAIILQGLGVPARSWTGWQVPLRTDRNHSDAKIIEIAAEVLEQSLAAGEVPVVTGFQGVDPDGRVATLGRGGSDLTAVALAAALDAESCDIYKDVRGIYTADPRVVPRARKLDKITYEEMLELAGDGAKVLQARAVLVAMMRNVPLTVRSSFDADPGTLVIAKGEEMEQSLVSGIASSRDEARVTLRGLPDRPGVAASVFQPLTEADVNVDMIVQSPSPDGDTANLTFTVEKADAGRSLEVLEARKSDIGFAELETDNGLVKISVIGQGMATHAGVAETMFRTLGRHGINIQVISTSEIKISVLIPAKYAELAQRELHSAYDLDGE